MLLDEMRESFPEADHVAIQQAITYLNRNQFFHAETPGNTSIRKALTSPKSRRFIDQAFTLLGYHFLFDDIQGWYGILPGEDISESRSMTLVDTLILLVVARTYNVRYGEGWIDGHGNVETSFNDFCDTVQSFAKPANMEIEVSQIRASLRKLEFMSIVNLGQKIEASGDIPMKIRPFISRILPMDVGKRLENFIQRKNFKADSLPEEGLPDNQATEADDDANTDSEN